ncbi:type II toxin-antitoxin system RelE/ParE family toxin [Herbaspirillum robiniae]|uniref:Type II toxin-antitoxin system RelE/ParE family toxin n=1 Tax=Herbaspirillum robiniae TaxID=2014887 RepID=A0ABX2M4G9_9BURK|nr:type II toxin-antitoxin system RelE/ParE family toxin [Herbaspirillum robiniae]NUU04153.1 type II toxin-antitoxin system RelE/ParE family toxin [Herbaspirillum robiniae]
MNYRVEHYITADQRHNYYGDWLGSLKDQHARLAIIRRVIRMEGGNFGDHKFCRDGVWELRIDTGPGYRVYFACADGHIVLLLCAGDKRRQDADIARAVACWKDWLRRYDHEKQTK